jgi:O-antigen/teichoic acid export membrane protein
VETRESAFIVSTSIRRLFRDSGILFLGSGLNAGTSLVQSIFVASSLGPEGLGIIAAALALPTLCAGLLGFRTSEALSAKYTAAAGTRNNGACARLLAGSLAADTVSAILTLLSCVLLSFAAWPLESLSPELSSLTVFYSGVFFLVPIINLGTAVLREQNRYALLSTVPVVASLVQLLWILIFAFQGGLSPLLVLVSYYVAQGAQALLLLGFAQRTLQLRFGLRLRNVLSALTDRSFLEERDFMAALRASYFSGSLTAIIKNGDSLLLGAFSGASDLGCYRIAKQLAGIVQIAGANLSAVIFQDFNHHWSRGESAEKLTRHVYRMLRLWGPVVVLGVLAGWLVAPVVVGRLYGADFTPAVYMFRILSVGLGVVTAFFWSQPLALSLGGWVLQSRVSLAAVAVFLALGVGLGSSLGASGVVIGVSASWATGTLLFVIFGLVKLRKLRRAATSQQ